MAHYLSFELTEDAAKQSDFADYALGTSNLLPRYFGELAPVNIFLGENNSGKSRFMREIMKRDQTRVFDFDVLNKLKLDVARASDLLRALSPTNLCSMEVLVFNPASQNPTFLELLSTSSESLQFNKQLRIDPAADLSETLKAIEELRTFIQEPFLFLNAVVDGALNRIIEQLQGCRFGLERAAKLYRAQTNGSFDGISGSKIDGKVVYSSPEANIIFLPGVKLHYGDVPGFLGAEATHAPVVITSVLAACEPMLKILQSLDEQRPEPRNRTYIPTLRTARTLTNTEGSRTQADVMKSTITADYELDQSGVVIHTGLSLYSAINQSRNTDMAEREEFEKFQDFLSDTFFNGKKVVIVPNHKKTTILVAVDREERALPHLGDGIQAIILLLYPLFIAAKGAWFFIEEPETHLHPGFQRLFINTIATHPVLLEKKLTVFLTTHSNHLLDFAQEDAKSINLFTFRKSLDENGKGKYQVQLTAPQDLECLNALGVQNSSVFLSNCTIWVEGITDRIYLKAYLEAFLKHRKQVFSLLEGLHYSFLEYAGANVSHYTFGAKSQEVSISQEALDSIQALSISNRIMLIADKDAGKEAKHERIGSQKHAGFEYEMLATREIENLLLPTVIAGALKKLYPKSDFDASKLQQEQYHDVYLGHYLRKKFPHIPETFAPPKPKGSGTISSAKKRQFAEAAAAVMTEWDMLSQEAKDLTVRVFKFIIGHNPRLGSN
jgi:hypothetical protein